MRRNTNKVTYVQHMESLHPDHDSPPPQLVNTAEDQLFQSSRGDDDDTEYTECPVDGCGELLTNEMIDFHAEMHGAEDSSSNSNLHGKAAGPAEHLETRGARSSGPSRSHREADRHRRANAEGPSSSKHPKLSLRSFFRMPDYFAHHHHHDGASKSRNKAGEKTSKSSATSGVSAGLRRLGVSADSSALSCRKYLLTSNSSLQKSQLGQHANEDRMPDSLVSLLKTGVGYHHLEGVVPVVAQLLQQSAATRHAYLCHPWVQHISKLRKEGMLRSSIGLPYCVSLVAKPAPGGFCGYRNIQMLCSYIISVKSPGYNGIDGRIPSIFQIQDYIESAWDAGINTQGRIETGGIKGTRKYIGTPEVCLSVLW